MSLEDCRDRLPIWALFGVLGLEGADKVAAWGGAGGDCKLCSPFRPDKSPSFSVWADGGKGFWKDHGTGESGDEVILIEAAKGVDRKEAMRIYHELARVPWGKDGGGGKAPWKPGPVVKKLHPVQGLEKPVSALAARVVGLPLEGKKPLVKAAGGKKEISEIYDYQDEKGNLLHQTIRFEPKEFRQRRPAGADEEGEWVWSLKDSRLVPYRLPEILAAGLEPIFLVEGEKDVHRLEALGEVIATTLPMGAGKWREEYAAHFAGRWVVLVPDFDEPGLEGAEKIARELFEVADRVGVLFLESLWSQAKPGHDIADWLAWGDELGMTVDEQREILMKQAERAGVDDLDFFAGIIYPGGRGGLTLLEDRLARNLVKTENLIFCADHFWKWDGGLGIWSKKRDRAWMERRIRGRIRSKGGEEVITANKVSSVMKLAAQERTRFPEELNSCPEGCFAVRNGILDLEKGKLYPHRQGHLITSQTPHPYIPGAECPEWMQWLEERQEDEATRAQIQEIFGYCLATGINYHSFFFFFGDGGTGKSTCVDTLEFLVGSDNKVALELTELDNPFTRAQLVGKSLFLAKELTTRSFKHIGMIKAIVSGDPIYVDVKFGTGFDFRPKGRLVMESNVIAATPDSSGGFERRFIQVNFDKPIVRKEMVYNYQERFLEEMPGILNWSLEGYRRLLERGRFEHTERSQAATDDLMKHRAGLQMFIKAGWFRDVPEEPGLMVKCSKVFELYNDWCELNDVVPHHKDMATFNRELFGVRKDWRDRKMRKWFPGEMKEQVITGLEIAIEEDKPPYSVED
jgi:putative DNA primase/helicase